MPVHNKEIIDKLNELADMLDIKGESQFRVRAYRTAARAVSGMTQNIAGMVEKGEDLSSLPGIGSSMSEKIREIAQTGRLKQLDVLREEIPPSLVEITRLEQVGPHRTRILNEELNINSLEDLEKAAESGQLEKVKGFGRKTAENIRKELRNYTQRDGARRIRRTEASLLIAPLMEYLSDKVEKLVIGGSFRRKKETVGDIDLVAVSNDPQKAMQFFTGYDETERILVQGDTRSSIILRTGLQVDLRIVDEASFGAALLYFTGSKDHTIALRRIAQSKDLKLNEYGIYSNDKIVASSTEKEIYEALGLNYIEPEIRENNGEIEAAMENRLPSLVELKDIKGDLHAHTTETDGKNTLQEMAEAAQAKGYQYLAITDHSKKVAMAKGLDEKRLAKQLKEIDKLNAQLKNFTILKAIEVDILEDGTLDLPDEILGELDMVVCSVHYHRKLSRNLQTQRIIRALNNPHVNILAHPTGRMIGIRDELDFDMEAVMKEAANNGCFLEINCNPDRLDLNDRYARMAKDAGVRISISTDAHSTGNFDYLEYGIAQARRGWLEKDDVLNTRSLSELKKLLQRK
jgi:DNA polymerase (family X)